MIKTKHILVSLFLISLLGSCSHIQSPNIKKDYVDYVNPYIGNISHLLVPTFPTIQLPNSMLRVYPERSDYTSERINGLPIIVTNHRERSAFNLTPYQGEELKPVRSFTYDNEKLTPYSYEAELDDNNMAVKYAVSHQSAIYMHVSYTRIYQDINRLLCLTEFNVVNGRLMGNSIFDSHVVVIQFCFV